MAAGPVQRSPEDVARAAALRRMSAGVASFAAALDSAVGRLKAYNDEKGANRDTKIWHLVREKWSLDDGQIQNPSAQS
jgi:hypothetical protein